MIEYIDAHICADTGRHGGALADRFPRILGNKIINKENKNDEKKSGLFCWPMFYGM